jgi:hypothetical protein
VAKVFDLTSGYRLLFSLPAHDLLDVKLGTQLLLLVRKHALHEGRVQLDVLSAANGQVRTAWGGGGAACVTPDVGWAHGNWRSALALPCPPLLACSC